MAEKLIALRRLLQEKGIDAYMVGRQDAHQSEYVTQSDQRLKFISSFTGSTGTAIITQTKALFWTDGRYWNQASKELSSDWEVMRSGRVGVPTVNQWIVQNIPTGKSVGVDPSLIPASTAQTMIADGISLVPIDQNLVDLVWGTDRPSTPANPIRHHPISLSGQSTKDKILRLQKQLKDNNCPYIVVAVLDEIAWLLNIRGSDIDFIPVVRSYLVVPDTGAVHWFLPEFSTREISDEVKNDLGLNPSSSSSPPSSSSSAERLVIVRPYSEIESFLINNTPSLVSNIEGNPVITVSSHQINWKLYSALQRCVDANPSLKITSSSSPSLISSMMCVKNEAELRGMRECHVRDGVALTAFFSWLDKFMKDAKAQNLPEEQIPTEYELSEILTTYRQKMDRFVSPSFGTIAAYGSNAAIVHYHPKNGESKRLGFDSLFLCDSGGQYLDGTTDITRTIHYGEPTQRMKECFTHVLKGHISLAQLTFPEGIYGSRLDAFARASLWSVGLDYNHGTGHGVGAHLNVHEGPHGIGSYPRYPDQGFECGMITSNEPGYYEDGAFGIRIENLCITTRANTLNTNYWREFCQFETISLCPIQAALIERSLLSPAEVVWLNGYHRQVREKLLPLMREKFPEGVEYLNQQTQELI